MQLSTTNAKSGWGKNRSAVIHEHRKPIGHHTSKILEGKRIHSGHSGSLHIRPVLLQRFHFDPFCFFVRCSSEAVRKAVRDITKTSGKRATTWCMNFGISDAPVKLDATFAYHSFNISYYHPGFHKISNYRLLKYCCGVWHSTCAAHIRSPNAEVHWFYEAPMGEHPQLPIALPRCALLDDAFASCQDNSTLMGRLQP